MCIVVNICIGSSALKLQYLCCIKQGVCHWQWPFSSDIVMLIHRFQCSSYDCNTVVIQFGYSTTV